MKKLRQIVLFIALGLGLMHSIVPHHHHNFDATVAHSLSFSEESNHQESFLHWLSNIFEFSHGTEHLENFQKGHSQNLSSVIFWPLPTQAWVVPVAPLQEPTPQAAPQQTPLPKWLRLSLQSLRSPPTGFLA